jgi:isoquinoline 1-oxidoreductase alpha subunit
MAVNMTVNGKALTIELPGDAPLLWALRDELKLTGTKFGCCIAQCGA